MDAMLDMLRSIGSPVDPLSIETLENNMRAGVCWFGTGADGLSVCVCEGV